MNNSHLSVVPLILIIFLGFELTPAHADDTNGVSIQNISIQPYSIKVGDTFTVTATLVNNSTVPIVVETGKCSSMDMQVPFFTVMFDNRVKSMTKNINCAGVGWSEILDPGKKNTSTSPDYTLNYTAIKSGTANVTVTFSYHAIIQKDPIQTGDEQTISKSFQFLIHDVNETYTQKPPAYFASPLQQIKAGVSAQNVQCGVKFNLVIKSEDGSPACVKPDTAQKLVERGWAINQKSTIMHVELDQSHYPPNNLDYYFVKGTIYTTSGPMQNSTVSIFGNNIPLGNAMTDPTGCFQFDSWNNTKINQEMYNASSNHQESYTLKITSAYLGDRTHDAVNDTKSAVVYFQLFPIPPPFYVSSTNPQTIQVKQGDSASLKLSVIHLTGGPVGPMELTVQRLPCGITYAIPSNAASNNGTFNISITTQDYTRVGKYYLDIIQDTSHFENPNIIPDPYIGMINLEVLSK